MLSNSAARMATSRKSARPGTRSTRVAPAARYGFLTVGQTARIIGVSPSTIRLWESEGLVAPIRTSGRYRLYSPELLKLLKRIKYLREVQRLNMPGIKRELRGSDVQPAGARRSASAPKPADRPLGPQLRKMRERKGLSLADAAKRSGISPGFLSAVERAHANASVSTLQHLATTYGSTVTELFHTSAKEDRLVGPDDRRVLRVHPGVQMELLSTGAPMLQSMLFRVAPLAGSEGSYSHQGEEFIYMLSGSLEIWLDELECHVLNEGDSFWFESMHAHRWMNPGGTEAVLLWINTPPTF
jgi:DNA-binding transcriptional MerR regulator/quercetin dioxygenase-like cupin family protein